jgi:hypothetical protein
MRIRKFYTQLDFKNFLENQIDIHEHAQFESGIMARRAHLENFTLDGYCKVCDQSTIFHVDKLYGSQEIEGGWLPNWRERLNCAHCQLINRQRAILHVIKSAILARQTAPIFLYAMEQISPLFQWLTTYSTDVICTGSEYLGENVESGTIIDGVVAGMRHENVESLSFADHNFDIIVSNDVLEHVNIPELALSEMFRVLKNDGEVFITIPFHINELKTVRRAELQEGKIHPLLPALYHGNPLSEEGSLVFHDFGWDFIEQMKIIGFQEVALCYYWSYLYGYLGDPQYYFWARKTTGQRSH